MSQCNRRAMQTEHVFGRACSFPFIADIGLAPADTTADVAMTWCPE